MAESNTEQPSTEANVCANASASVSAGATSTSTSTMPRLPPALPPLAASSPSRAMLQSIVDRVSNAVTAVTSPLRRNVRFAAPVNQINTSPSTSIAHSELTGQSPSCGSSTSIASERESEDAIKQMAAVEYSLVGDGGDSDEEGMEINFHNDAVDPSEIEDDNGLDEDDFGIPGAPSGWQPPPPPPTHKGYQPKPNSDAPATFEMVDNPGKWNDFMFREKYKNGKYDGHYTPCGAKVLPADEHGKRSLNGWDFYYDGWSGDDFTNETYVRGSATAQDIKPSDRCGLLDVVLLKKYGMNKETVSSPLHWHQLLFPICDPNKSGIENDGRMPFFTTANANTNIYSIAAKQWGGGYGHTFSNTEEYELVRWMGVPIRHGARGGTPLTLHYRWCPSDEDYDNKIADAMTLTRWRQIKSVFKLNNNLAEPSRGTAGYDPCNKYDMMCRVLCHNMNLFTMRADMDSGLDETTWGFMGYMAECGGRLKNKPVSKGDVLFLCYY